MRQKNCSEKLVGKMRKDSIRYIVVIFQATILRIVGFYVRHLAIDYKETLYTSSIVVDLELDMPSFVRINFRFQNIMPLIGPPVNDLDFLSLHCVCMYLCCRWKSDVRWATPRKPV